MPHIEEVYVARINKSLYKRIMLEDVDESSETGQRKGTHTGTGTGTGFFGTLNPFHKKDHVNATDDQKTESADLKQTDEIIATRTTLFSVDTVKRYLGDGSTYCSSCVNFSFLL